MTRSFRGGGMHAENAVHRRVHGRLGARGLDRGAHAGPWEDGMVAYNRGDYVPAIRLFRPLAEAGNPRRRTRSGVMYRKGEGVVRSPARPSCGSALPPRSGDTKAKAGLRDVSKTHDAGGNLAGPADGAGLRGLELPGLRILIRRQWRRWSRRARSRPAPE